MKIFLVHLLSILSLVSLFAQEQYLPLDQSYNHWDRYVYQPEYRFHTSVRPYLKSQTDFIVSIDTLYKVELKNRFANHLINNNWLRFKRGDFKFTVDPVFNLEYGKNRDTSLASTYNTRGVQVDGSIGDQFAFHTAFYENQAFVTDYRNDRILASGRSLIPGQGIPKSFKENGYDYAYAEGYFSYTTKNDIFNFQLGHGKNFIGDGYRSLLLSDNSYNYPFLKITTDVWNLKYVNLWAQFQDLYSRNPEIGFDKKWGTFHYLDWSATKWLNIAFFEAIIWQNADSTGYRGFDVNYANPVIFFRPVEFSVGSPDNALMGMNGKITLGRHVALYGQILLDEFLLDSIRSRNGWWGNKYGLQAGMKVFDIFNISHLDLQGELNYVRPFTYAHRSTRQNYGHYNQPLAHPLGSNFEELVCFIRYNYKRLFFEGRFSYAIHGQDTAGLNFGNNIFIDYTTHAKENDNYIGQAVENTLIYTDINVSYLINPMTNMNIVLGLTNRKQESALLNSNEILLYFAFRTSLSNFYYDF